MFIKKERNLTRKEKIVRNQIVKVDPNFSKAINIALITQYNTPNVGDKAIEIAERKILESAGATVDSFSFWDAKRILKMNGSSFVARAIMHLPFLLDCLVGFWVNQCVRKKYDAVVIGGGELLCEHRGFNSALLCWTRYFEKKKVPIFLYSISGESQLPNQFVKRYKQALRRCNYICARDNNSKKTICDIYSRSCDYYPDVVYSLEEVVTEKHHNNQILVVPVPFENEMKKTIGVGDIFEYADYLKSLIKEQNIDSKIVFTVTEQRDEKRIMELVDIINKEEREYCIYKKYDGLATFCELIQESSVVISARMHALIIGQVNDKKVISIPFKEKLCVFSKENTKFEKNELVTASKEGLYKLIRRIDLACKNNNS